MDLVLAVAGDKNYTDFKMFSKILKDELERFPATMIVTGDSTGVDTMVHTYCMTHNIPVRIYCASLMNHRRLINEGYDVVLATSGSDGHAALPARNAKLLMDANRVLLFDGGDRESKSIRKLAHDMGKDIEDWEVTTKAGTRIADYWESKSREAGY